MTLFGLYNDLHTNVARFKSDVAMAVLLLAMSLLSVGMRAAVLPMSVPADVDTTAYRSYPYIRFVNDKDSFKIDDEKFFDIAGKVIFPINKWNLPKGDSLILQLEKEVFPLINRDSLELVHMMLRGAASPEGPTRFNKFLGEHRAETLLNFIKANITAPIDESFEMEIDVEDYRTLCLMMRRMGDKDYGYVQAMCDQYLPKNQIDKLKSTLRNARKGTLWHRLFREYFPRLRAARIVFFFRAPTSHAPKVIIETPEVEEKPVQPDTAVTPPVIEVVVPEQPQTEKVRLPRRELMSVKSNLLFDFAYVPGYDRWCPIPNLAVEYYPLHGHFTYGFSLDFPWWQHYHDYKFFQFRNYQFETRYYFRSGDIRKNIPGQGAAFRGWYLQGYAHAGLFGICFGKYRGWEGEGLGAGVGAGYVLPLSRNGHWRLEFNAQVGFFFAKYDPYQYGNPKTTEEDDLYYYKWTLDRDLFKRRQYRFNWVGPTRVGVTLVYDLLYRRIQKPRASFRSWEWLEAEPDDNK